jgi:hypothetical protein
MQPARTVVMPWNEAGEWAVAEVACCGVGVVALTGVGGVEPTQRPRNGARPDRAWSARTAVR